MAPFVEVAIERERLCAARMLGDDDLGAACVEIGDDGVAIEGFVGDQAPKGDAVEQRRNSDRVEAMARHEAEADQIAQRVGEREDFGRHTAFGAADGLALSPPFAP